MCKSGWLCNKAEFKMARIQDGCHHQFEWEWRSLSQIELIWVRVLFKMAESKMAEFKMAAIIKLSQNEWVKFFCANGGNQCWEVWVGFRGNTKMAESKMAEFKLAEFKIAAIIKFTWEGMSLSHIELVWFRVRLEWGCFGVNLRKDNEVSESKMAVSESNMAELEMAVIIMLSQNEWVWVRLN